LEKGTSEGGNVPKKASASAEVLAGERKDVKERMEYHYNHTGDEYEFSLSRRKYEESVTNQVARRKYRCSGRRAYAKRAGHGERLWNTSKRGCHGQTPGNMLNPERRFEMRPSLV